MAYMSRATQELLNRARSSIPSSEAPVAGAAVAIGERLHRMVAAMESMAETRNPTDTEAAHALKVSKAAGSIRAEAKKAADRLLEIRTEGTFNLQRKIDAITGLATMSPDAAEVRAIFRSMATEAKMQVVQDALAAKDNHLLSSILGAHPFLSGIDRQYQHDMIKHYEAKVAPELVAEQEALAEVGVAIRTLIGAADQVAREAERPDYVAKVADMARQADAAQAEFNQAVAPAGPFAAE